MYKNATLTPTDKALQASGLFVTYTGICHKNNREVFPESEKCVRIALIA